MNNAKRYSPYSNQWTRTRTTGRKPSNAGTTETAAVTGYVAEKRLQPAPLLQPLGGAGISSTVHQWQWVSATDQDVRNGDTLTNADDTSVVYRIATKPSTASGNLVADATERT